MPTAAENTNPPAIAGAEITIGQPAMAETASEAATMMMLAIPPVALRNTASVKLQQNLQAACAQRHSQSDLARPLGDRDQQDVHDSDAADQQRYRRHCGE